MSSRKKKRSSDRQTQLARIAKVRQTPAAQLERLEDRQYRSGNHEIGINVNQETPASFKVAVPVLRQLGITSVRLWCGVKDMNSRTFDDSMDRAIDYHNAGFDVTLTVAQNAKTKVDPSEVKDWFTWAAGNDALRKAVDRWEIGNEVDSSYYFNGTLKDYVDDFLKPASQALRAQGEKVVSAGVSWNPQDVQRLIDNGMLNYVDAIGFHPYAKGVALQKKRIAEVNSIVAGRKPIIATEWNVRGNETNKAAWAQSVEDAYSQVASGFDIDYYFCLFTQNTPAGPGGLLNKSDNSINTRFYNAFKKSVQALNGQTPTPTPPPTDNPDPTSPPPPPPPPVDNGGNVPDQVVSTTLALYDADTNKVISGYSELESGDIINLADMPTRHLALVVLTTKKVGSVKMSMGGKTVIQNSAPFAYFGDTGGDIQDGNLDVGSYTMKITPFANDDGAGTAYASQTVKFKVIDKDLTDTGSGSGSSGSGSSGSGGSGSSGSGGSGSSGSGSDDSGGSSQPPKPTPSVDSISLVDAVTGKIIEGYDRITGDTTVHLSDFATRDITFVANTTATKSVKVVAAGLKRVENALPYAYFGDHKGDYYGWHVSVGSYKFTATAYAAKNAKGVHGDTKSIQINFV